MRTAKDILYISSGFVGGFVAGYLAANYRESKQFKVQKERIDQVISRFNRTLKERQERFSVLNDKLKREFRDPFPDLYRATESLSLDESELIYD